MNKLLPIGIGLVLVAVVGGVVYMQNQPAAPVTPSGQTTTNTNPNGPDYLPNGTPGTTQTPSEQHYTLADVAKHADGTSCWTVINGGVYDVTAWIGQHPGGQSAILSLCGHDGSDAFNGQHGGQRRPASELATFKIGTLAQ